MLSTKKYNNNTSIYANIATFDNVSKKRSITNDSLTNSLTAISGNINNINLSIITISGS